MAKKIKLAKGRKPTNDYQKQKYKDHYFITERNRLRKHKNHIKIHPNDLQAINSMRSRGLT